MQALLPHLSTAVELYNRLGIAESRCSGLAQALDRIETAVILVDARSRCVFVNAAAERLERENKGLHFGPNGITASTAVATAELRAAIASLVKSPTAEGACLSLALASQRSPLLLRLFSLQEIAANLVGTADPCVAIFVRERKVASAPDAATLAEAFGLTRRESEIAHLIALGVDLGEIADRLELGVGTVRNHLKRAFEKTGTHSQAAMVALIRGALAL
jgi:DNA-binding CsgD family transcriptional regulator